MLHHDPCSEKKRHFLNRITGDIIIAFIFMCLYETKEETYATVALMVQEGLCASMEPTSM
jgi:hypothetical protein